jgi:hypothetical protein
LGFIFVEAVAVIPSEIVAFVKEGFRMFMPPRRSSLAIFPDENSEPHAGTAVSILAGLAKFH